MILGTYKIKYTASNTVQIKNLITHSDYLKGKMIKVKSERDKYYSQFGENWFTNESPLFKAMKTGLMDVNDFVHEVEFEKI